MCRCEDMKVDPSDVKLLVLAWAMGATRMGYFTRDEWMSGVPRFGNATTPPDLLEEVHNLYQALLRDVERFRELYGFTHRFCREERRKTIDVCWRRGPLSNSGESYAHEQPCCRLYPAELLPFCPAAASERHMTLNQQVASAVVMLELLLKPMWPAHIASLSSFMNDHKQLVRPCVCIPLTAGHAPPGQHVLIDQPLCCSLLGSTWSAHG